MAVTSNRVVRAANQQREAWSGIDVQLRNQAAGNPARTDAAENERSHGITRLLAVAEAYPELRASEDFRTLNAPLTAIEDDLQFARRYHNGSVRDFRNLAESFPAVLIAGPFGIRPGEFFEVDSATERHAPEVRLG